MGHEPSSVGSIVSSLLSAFGRGYDALRKRGRKKEGTGELSRVLKKGRKDVRTEYRHGMDRIGEGFGGVDGRASLNLAQTLLKLNAGLVDIVAGLLETKRKKNVDWGSLTALSELCSREAVGTLSDLRRRLSRPDVRKNEEKSQQLVKYQNPKKRHATRSEKKSSSDAGKPYWELQLVRHKPKSLRKSSSSRSSRQGQCECCSKRGHAASRSTPTLPRTGSEVSSSRRHTRSSSVKTAASSTSLSSQRLPRYEAAQKYGMSSIPELEHPPPKRHERQGKEQNQPDCTYLPTHRLTADDHAGQDPRRTSPRITRPTAPDRPFGRAATARYSMASTKIGEIPLEEWCLPPTLEQDSSHLDPQPWGWGGPVSSVVNGGKATKFGLFNIFKKRLPQRVI
ncbi:Hypothetical protein D9617_20g027730 [Elsinoe fawcettii]|nr:Hypothetical protein D9617_20g027730 [Elsinoe fawcettii]